MSIMTPINYDKYKGHKRYFQYLVSEDGRVFSPKASGDVTLNELSQSLNKFGYLYVRLLIGSKRKNVRVHTIVANAFIGPKPSSKHQIRHLDGSKTNNNVNNLAWGTAKENADDRARHGRTSCGLKHSRAIKKAITYGLYDKSHAVRAKKLMKKGFRREDIADDFNVSQVTIYNWQKEYPEFAEALKKFPRHERRLSQ